MNSGNSSATAKRLAASIIAVVVLIFCPCLTAYALVTASVTVPDNYVQTGTVEINLNDGKPVIEEHEFIFEPGMTVAKDFFIENRSTWEVYFKLYFDEVSGGLADVLLVTVKDGEKVLLEGAAAELSGSAAKGADTPLLVNEKRQLTLYLHYPETAGNSTQAATLSFKLCAEAVQTKNNPGMLFD